MRSIEITVTSRLRRDRDAGVAPTGLSGYNSVAMYVVAVTVFVKGQFISQFIEATLENARNTRREQGNVRFDVLRAEEEAGRFMLYEAYRTKEDFAQHQQTEHYLKWKQTVADWMDRPRQGVKHQAIFFGDAEVV